MIIVYFSIRSSLFYITLIVLTAWTFWVVFSLVWFSLQCNLLVIIGCYPLKKNERVTGINQSIGRFII